MKIMTDPMNATEKDLMEGYEQEISDLGDNLDGADIFGILLTVADHLDMDLEAALTLVQVNYSESDIDTDMIDRVNDLSRSEVHLIRDLIENSQSNPSSAYPALLRMAEIDNLIADL